MHGEEESPRKTGVRTGLVMIASAILASPLVSMLGELLPSRENTIIDELPAMLLSWALIGIGVAGAAKVVYSLVAERRRASLRAAQPYDQLDQPRHHRVQENRIVDRSTRVQATHDTPV